MGDTAKSISQGSTGRCTKTFSQLEESDNRNDPYLASSGLSLFLFDLNLEHFTWMLNDLGDVGLVRSADFSCYPFYQIKESSIHPVLPEHPGSRTERCPICLDHAERPVDRPENEKYDEEMMCEPESFVISSPKLSSGRGKNEHESNQHDVPRPARTSGEVCEKEPFEA